MIEFFAAAAADLPVGFFEPAPHPIQGLGFVGAVGVLPLVAGIIYARNWKACLVWVLLASSVVAAWLAGSEFNIANWNGASLTLPEALGKTATFVVLPSLASVLLGVVARKIVERLRQTRATIESVTT